MHRHPDAPSITWPDIEAAAEDAGITPDQAVENMREATEMMESGAILKAEEARRYLLTVVYSPHRMPLRGADKKVDLATPEVLEKACWVYTIKGLGTGMWHEDGHAEEAVCVENYVYRGPDWVLKDAAGNEQVIKAGTWLAGYILSPRAWSMYKSGRIGGVSMQGAAGRKPASAEALALVGGNTV
jgi:putative serine protease XkdF